MGSRLLNVLVENRNFTARVEILLPCTLYALLHILSFLEWFTGLSTSNERDTPILFKVTRVEMEVSS